MPDRQQLLDLVASSPRAVAAHDKEGWIGLFGRDYLIEDPVGSRPVRGPSRDPISRFWDAFIAPNDIEFVVHQDYVDGLHVVRDVTIEITLPTGVQVVTPAHLRYEAARTGSGLEVRRMAAHWEPLPVYRQLLHPGVAYLRSMGSMGGRMLRHLGPVGTAAFVGAVRSVGERGKQAVRDRLGGTVADLHQVIAAGEWVTASGTVDGAPAAVFATVDRRTFAVTGCRVYTDLA